MMFLIFVAVAATAYFAWRIVDQLPDIVYRLSEIQRDLAEIRRRSEDAPLAAPAVPDAPAVPESEDEDST
ncbi:MAG: hypothetical protein J4F45_09710 [Pseudomonadales bacterium]|nr:hypothetical protein [Pseudomonadales bacterium]